MDGRTQRCRSWAGGTFFFFEKHQSTKITYWPRNLKEGKGRVDLTRMDDEKRLLFDFFVFISPGSRITSSSGFAHFSFGSQACSWASEGSFLLARLFLKASSITRSLNFSGCLRRYRFFFLSFCPTFFIHTYTYKKKKPVDVPLDAHNCFASSECIWNAIWSLWLVQILCPRDHWFDHSRTIKR